jgi:hypothetical protein
MIFRELIGVDSEKCTTQVKIHCFGKNSKALKATTSGAYC